MSAGTNAAIVVAVIIVAALIAGAFFAARRHRLRQLFGPEYDRVIEGSDSRLQAEAELASRMKRVRRLGIRPLGPAARAAYRGQWTAIQQQFVDTPVEAVTAAQTLITGVMADRGYPTEDAGQIVDDLSVDHAATIGRLRTAQDISARAADGTASTEDLRQAMIHYRALFDDLLGEPAEVPHDATEPAAPVPGRSSAIPHGLGPGQPDLDEPDLDEPDLDEPGLDDQAEPGRRIAAALAEVSTEMKDRTDDDVIVISEDDVVYETPDDSADDTGHEDRDPANGQSTTAVSAGAAASPFRESSASGTGAYAMGGGNGVHGAGAGWPDAPDASADPDAHDASARDDDNDGNDDHGEQVSWPQIQALFVDDPRSAVRQAADVMSSAMSAFVAAARDREQALADSWQADTTGTEELRTALRGYRALSARISELADQI